MILKTGKSQKYEKGLLLFHSVHPEMRYFVQCQVEDPADLCGGLRPARGGINRSNIVNISRIKI